MFCPQCESEYRPGFEMCAHCEVALVEELGVQNRISLDEFDDTVPVGVASSSDLVSIVEIQGRKLDRLRVHVLEVAQGLQKVLEAQGVAQIVTPIEDVEFSDRRPRFEVRVRKPDHGAAEDILRAFWKENVEAEGTEAEEPQDPEACPACGASVPANEAECPECGLYVGVLEEE